MKPVYLFVLPWSLEHAGGVNQVVLNLAREVERDGRLRPMVLIADWSAPRPAWGEFEGITTLRWRLRALADDRRGVAAWWDRWLCGRFQTAFAAFCRAQQVQVVNCHYFGGTAFALAPALEGASSRPALIVSIHGTDITHSAQASPGHKQRMRGLLEACAAVVAPTQDLARRCQSALALAAMPQVIPNGVDADWMAAGGGPAEPPAAPTVLSVGRFDAAKGQDVLLRAFASLQSTRPELQLCLVGAHATGLEQLQHLARELGCSDRVSFHVDLPHRQLADFYRKATLFVLPSRQESFGIVLLEAGSFGVPVIATQAGGIPEVITDGVTGRLVPPDDVTALARAIANALDAPERSQSMASRFERVVRREFTWRRAGARYLELAGLDGA